MGPAVDTIIFNLDDTLIVEEAVHLRFTLGSPYERSLLAAQHRRNIWQNCHGAYAQEFIIAHQIPPICFEVLATPRKPNRFKPDGDFICIDYCLL